MTLPFPSNPIPPQSHIRDLRIPLPPEAPLHGLLVGFPGRDVRAVPVAGQEAVGLQGIPSIPLRVHAGRLQEFLVVPGAHRPIQSLVADLYGDAGLQHRETQSAPTEYPGKSKKAGRASAVGCFSLADPKVSLFLGTWRAVFEGSDHGPDSPGIPGASRTSCSRAGRQEKPGRAANPWSG